MLNIAHDSPNQPVLAKIKDEIRAALQRSGISPELASKVPIISVPATEVGDLGFHCGIFSQELHADPAAIADSLTKKLAVEPNSLIDHYFAVGAYINVSLNKTQFNNQVLQQIWQQADDYGANSLAQPHKVVIDMSSPNIAKRMSVGHLRSTIIGDALARIYLKLGYEVVKDNHLGDWGTQFGHLLAAIELWGDEAQIAKDPIPELQKLYVKVSAVGDPQSEYYVHQDLDEATKQAEKIKAAGRAWFKRLEEGDETARKRWQQIVDWSLADFQKTYDRLGVTFDLALGESFYEPMLQEIIHEAYQKGVAQESEGAIVVNLEDVGLGTSIIQKSDGATIYMTRDIATAKYRFTELHADRLIYVVGNDQNLYLKQLFEIMHRLGYAEPAQMTHVSFGMIRLPDGKMSTRKGRVVMLDEVIDEAVKRATKLVEERTRVENVKDKERLIHQVAIGAIKWTDLSGDPGRTITFDWDKIISLEGNSAAYLQYAYARSQSLLQKGQFNEHSFQPDFDQLELGTEEEFELALSLAKFPESIEQAAANYNPSGLAIYLYDLAKNFTRFYHSVQIVTDDRAQTTARLVLTTAFGRVLRLGLELLGIEVPQRM